MCMSWRSRGRGLAVHVVVGRCPVVPGMGIAGGVPGGYTGGVIRDPPSAKVSTRKDPGDSGAGPEGPAGAWSGGLLGPSR